MSFNQSNSTEEQGIMEEELNQQAHQLIIAAKEKAQEMINVAEEKAMLLKRSAEEEIQKWWKENEIRLTTLSRDAETNGYKEGFEIGKKESELMVQQEYQEKLEQIQAVLQKAYEEKARIISEAEPFLLELSTAIAKQIIKQELENSPDRLIEIIKKHILRFKEKDSITVCVHPEDFELIQSKRSQLVSVVNGETEIKIIPDHSVSAKGCIIRTAYGSVDARIDTQIEEIKKVLLEARREPDFGVVS
jgi:flagellar assembly protein FliH